MWLVSGEGPVKPMSSGESQFCSQYSLPFVSVNGYLVAEERRTRLPFNFPCVSVLKMYLFRDWVLEISQFFVTHCLSCPASRIFTKKKKKKKGRGRMQLKESCVIIKFTGWQWGLGVRIRWGLLNH